MVNGQSQVNVEIIESVLVYGEFVRTNTSCPIISHLPKITFCDIDDDHSGPKEVVKVDGIKAADAVDDVTDSDFGLRAPGTLTSGSPFTTQNITSTSQTQVAGRMARQHISRDGGKFGVQVTSKEIGTLFRIIQPILTICQVSHNTQITLQDKWPDLLIKLRGSS